MRCPKSGKETPEDQACCSICGSHVSGGDGPNETILASVAANLFYGAESVGGRLKITDRRMQFKPHVLNLQTNPTEIALSDIIEVNKRKTMGFVPNGMLVRTSAGVEYHFVVWRREKLIRLIQSQLPKA